MSTVILVEGLSKQYRLGQIGGRMLSEDLNRWWARFRGKSDKYLKVGQEPLHSDGYVWALRDINLSITDGDVVGAIGPNGAGKSTLLKILSRVTAPTSGTVRVRGKIASLLEVATGFHPDLTGRENIFLNGALLGMSKVSIKKRFDEIVAFAEIGEFIDTPVKRYSSGMYVRLAFAVAAHLDAEILLIDEVLAVGDISFQRKCLSKMGDISKTGRTILFVSHNMQIIATLCNKGIHIENGNLKYSGETKEAIESYLGSIGIGDAKAEVDLTHPSINRRGNGKSKFIWLRLLGSDGIARPIFQVGESFTMEMECMINKLDHGQFYQVRIANSYGVPIYHWVDFDANLTAPNRDGLDKVRITLPQISLYPGQYIVSIMVSDRYGTEFDYIQNIISFNVVPGSLIEMRRRYYPSLGIIHDIPKWERLNS